MADDTPPEGPTFQIYVKQPGWTENEFGELSHRETPEEAQHRIEVRAERRKKDLLEALEALHKEAKEAIQAEEDARCFGEIEEALKDLP